MDRSSSAAGRKPDDDGTNVNDLGPLLLAQLCEPNTVKSFELSERSDEDGVMLSHVPWAISAPEEPLAISAGRKRRRNASTPNYSYLDLRLSQNAAWAQSQLQRGVEHARKAQAIQDEMRSVTEASAREYKKAEQCYRDGLDLVPSHPELLVALGALCANLGGRDDEAADVLTRAVEVTSGDAIGKDSSVGNNARKYLNEVMRRIGREGGGVKTKETDSKLTHKQLGSTEQMQQKISSASKGGEARAEKAYLDAMAEQAFLSGDTSKLKDFAGRNRDSKGSSKYELLAEPSSEDEEEFHKMKSNDREDEERYRKRRKKKKHRSRRESRHRSKKRSSRKHKKSKRSKRKRRYRSSSSGSESNDVSSSEEYSSSEEESISTESTSSRSRSKSTSRKYSHKQRQKKRKRRSKDQN